MSKLASFAAGFGGGYLKARDKEYERERQEKADARQAKLDDMQAEQFGWARDAAEAKRRERADKEAIDRAVTEGMSAGTVQDAGAVRYADADGAQKTAYQPDLKTAEFAAEQQRLEEGQSLTPPATPSAPQAEQAASVRTLGGARRLFSGLTAASDAKKFVDENPVTPYAKFMAMSEKLSTMAGGQEKADAYLKRAKEAEKEGAFRALTMLDAGDPEGALKAWNSTGAKRLGEGQKFVTVADKAGNKIHRVVNSDGLVVVPNVEQAMLRYLSGIEGAAASAKARAEAEDKIRAKLAEPVVVGDGGTFIPGVGDTRQGFTNPKSQVVPRGAALVTEGASKPAFVNTDTSGGSGDGTGGGKGKGKEDDPRAVATTAVMNAIKESAESKTLNADQLIGVQATVRSLVDNAARNNQQLDPYVAGKVALTAALKPESVKPAYNRTTGEFENTVAYNGNTFSVGKVDQATMPESQLKSVAQAYVSKLPPESRSEYIKAATGDVGVLRKIDADIAASHGREWTERFTAATGRRPTQQDINASIDRTRAIVQQNIALVGASGAVEQDKKQRETASRQQAQADAQKAIGTPESIMALPPGEAQKIYAQYNQYTNARQREALQNKMRRDRLGAPAGGLRQP
jgi:hypothetical protein